MIDIYVEDPSSDPLRWFVGWFMDIFVGDSSSGPLRWFMHDSDYAAVGAEKHQPDPGICDKIRHVIEQHNPFWTQFRQLSESPSEDARLELSVGEGRELAAVICDTRTNTLQTRKVICHKKATGEPMFLDTFSGLYMPLHYVLICPEGTMGWDLQLKKDTGLTLLKYTRQFLLRSTALKYLSGLCNEFPLDFQSAVNDQTLSFLRNRSNNICQRKELASVGAVTDPGKTFLPASFPGSRWHQQEMIADALAVLGRFENPPYFVTMTCNPKWEEIESRLKPGQNASDRPDILNQVFKAKLQDLQACLVDVFRGVGKIYRIHVIEFQKRGENNRFFDIENQSNFTSLITS